MSGAVIEYGSNTINDASAAKFVGVTSYNEDLERGQFQFEVVVRASSNLDAACLALENAYRERNNDFRFRINGVDVVDWQLTGNKSVLNVPSIVKLGSQYDTRNSRRYRITINAELSANVQSRAGERPYNWSVSRDDQLVRTLTLSGQYTAYDSNTAYEQYEASIDALATTVQGFVDPAVSWEQISESVDSDDEGAVATYSLTWREATGGGTLTYGGFTVGGAAPTYPIYGELGVAYEYQQVRVTADVLIVAADAAALATAESTLVAAFRKPRQDLVVSYGGTPAFTATQAAGTVIDAEPTIDRTGDPSFAGVAARTYRITIVAQLPADNLGLNGRRESDISVSWSPARRRRLTITGTYTSYGAVTTGEAAYEAQIQTYTDAVAAAAGGTWDLISDQTDTFETRKVLRFSRTIEERIYTNRFQSSEVRDQRVVVVLTTPGLQDTSSAAGQGNVGGTGGEEEEVVLDVNRPREFRGMVSGYVIASVSDDDFLAIQRDAYDYLLGAIREQIPGGQIAVMSENVDGDRDNRSFAVTLSGTIASTGWLELTITESVQQTTGTVVEPAWGGDPLSAYVYQTPGELNSTVTRQGLYLGDPPEWAANPPSFAGTQAVLMSANDQATPLVMGRADRGDSYAVAQVSQSRVYRHFVGIDFGSGVPTGG